MNAKRFDIVISGTGYVGLTAACLLAEIGLNILLINRNNSVTKDNSGKPSRLFSIASGSMEIFNKINIKKGFEDKGQEIKDILVYDYVNKEKLVFSAKDINQDSFGIMIDEHLLLHELEKKCDSYPNISKMYSANIDIHNEQNIVKIINQKNEIISDLFVIAEGKFSDSRQALDFDVHTHDYHHDAIICDIEHELNHQGKAIENFMPAGPFAILPKKGGYRSCIVWSESSGMGEFLSRLNNTEIEQLLQKRMSNCFGSIKLLSKVSYYPLKLILSNQYYTGRSVLCGDALHGIHPIAGQGLNLGLRDIECLAQLIKKYVDLGLDIGSEMLLKEYQKSREHDISLMVHGTHFINYFYMSKLLSSKIIRKIGMKIIDNSSFIKNRIVNYACGHNF